jgi:hypothetical protein
MSTTTALPATGTAVAPLEPCFLDLITAIEQAKELPERTRRHWACSLRQIAKWLEPCCGHSGSLASGADFHCATASREGRRDGQNAGEPPIECAGGAALVRQGAEHPSAGRARLSPEWARFLQQLERSIRQRLHNLVRYCSARCIGPTSVDDTLFDEYWRYRAENTGRATNNTAKRFMVRAWNGCLAATDCRCSA